MAAEKIETRLAALEAEVLRLKNKIEGEKKAGWKNFVGAFLDDPYFKKAMQYGQQWRKLKRPKKSKNGKRSHGNS
jgi:hypothetical protein